MKSKWTVIGILAISQFVMILDSTVMNVSISTVATDLGTTISGMQAAITFYALTMAALMLTGGKLGDIWGRKKAFVIGSIVYGIGSFLTALSPNLPSLLFGWSLVEGLGAILVIPAIAALAAVNYKGKDRVVAFSILGAITGLAAALGPIIGGYVTTYLSWRYVFVAETIIMIGVLLVSKHIMDEKLTKKTTLDIKSVILSASGMGMLVLGVLQSKTWGWLIPKAIPSINGYELAPLGISMVAYLILAGIIVLKLFISRQRDLEAKGKDALLKVSMLNIKALRSGLNVFFAQYFIIAALFFVVPVYLQTILGLDALQTGIKLVPLSIGLVIFSVIGSKQSAKRSARTIARAGQAAMAFGALLIIGSIEPELRSAMFKVGMFTIGAGFGLLASQLGNVNMSAVGKDETAEVGGLQGTFQNLGTSFGTALVGSIFMMALASGFNNSVQASPNVPQNTKTQIETSTSTGVAIVSAAQATQILESKGLDQDTTQEVVSLYQDSQVEALKQGMFFVFAMAVIALMLSKELPSTIKPE
jgi:MFS family permease